MRGLCRHGDGWLEKIGSRCLRVETEKRAVAESQVKIEEASPVTAQQLSILDSATPGRKKEGKESAQKKRLKGRASKWEQMSGNHV
jgi:hypothetical protein